MDNYLDNNKNETKKTFDAKLDRLRIWPKTLNKIESLQVLR